LVGGAQGPPQGCWLKKNSVINEKIRVGGNRRPRGQQTRKGKKKRRSGETTTPQRKGAAFGDSKKTLSLEDPTRETG